MNKKEEKEYNFNIKHTYSAYDFLFNKCNIIKKPISSEECRT